VSRKQKREKISPIASWQKPQLGAGVSAGLKRDLFSEGAAPSPDETQRRIE